MSIHGLMWHRGAQPVWKRWLVLLWFLLAFTLGAYGYWRYNLDNFSQASLSDAFYHSLQLFLLRMPSAYSEINWSLDLSRWMAAGLFGYVVLAALLRLFARQVAWLRLQSLSGHVVVCGLSHAGLQVVRSLRTTSHHGSRRAVVVIDPAPEPERAREAEALGAQVIIGDATRAEVLSTARAGQARRLMAFCAEDATNLQVAMQARPLAGVGGRTARDPLVCHLQVRDVELRMACQHAQAFAEGDSGCQVRFLDLFDAVTRRLLLRDMPLDRAVGVRPDETRTVLLVIIGLGRMGQSLAARAAKLGQFANGRKLRIQVIDRQAAAREQELLFRFPAFREACDLECHALEAESWEARRRLESWFDCGRFIPSMALCLEDEVRSTEMALRWLPALRESQVPLAVRYTRDERLVWLLQELKASGSSGRPGSLVHPFGLLDGPALSEALSDELNDGLATTLHELRREARLPGKRFPEKDRSLWPWEKLEAEFRESLRQETDHLPVKLRAIGVQIALADDPRPAAVLSTEEVELLARLEHVRWRVEQQLAGWRSYAERSEQISPELVPWEQLSQEHQDRRREGVRMIPALLERCGEKAVRL